MGKIGQEFKLTSSYLSRRFKNFTGISIFDYLMKLRIKRAKELLVSTEESIEKVAESVGFLSSAALIRDFKKLESMTPGAFRRLYRERKTSENDNSYHLLSI